MITEIQGLTCICCTLQEDHDWNYSKFSPSKFSNSFLSTRRLAFLPFDISFEKFLENSLHLYLMYSHRIMGSAKEEPSLANAWISVLRDSVKCLSFVKELLNFQYALPCAHSEVGKSFSSRMVGLYR